MDIEVEKRSTGEESGYLEKVSKRVSGQTE
jgi:hypothetical protein